MNLDAIFSAVAYKRLAQVDLPGGSNQHEINGSARLLEFFNNQEFGPETISWIYFADDTDPVHSSGYFRFYDSRKKSYDATHRIEWRMYYRGDFLQIANPLDLLVLIRTSDEKIFGLIFEQNSGWERAINQILKLNISQIEDSFSFVDKDKLTQTRVDFYTQEILSQMGLYVPIPVDNKIENLAEQIFNRSKIQGKSLPKTKEMATYVWENTKKEIDVNNADSTLVTWLDVEEKLFRAVEKIDVGKKIETGFTSVDDFIKYSLSVQNRRKSRMGFALQNHLAEIFRRNKIKFKDQCTTEGKNKPDFIFPGYEEYHNPKYDSNYLFMLGAKSTCKERWRQILTEANRIDKKHLCTLDQAISYDQTEEMSNHSVILVIPQLFREAYLPEQKGKILTVNEFISFIKEKQSVSV